MNTLIKGMQNTSNVTTTAKGAKSSKSTLNSCVDLFGSIGSMRARSDAEVIKAFTNAFGEDPLKAMKILFFVRDIRGGLGERKVPRTILKYLADAHTDVMRKNLHLVEKFGRIDDYFIFIDTPLETDAFSILKNKLISDCNEIGMPVNFD